MKTVFKIKYHFTILAIWEFLICHRCLFRYYHLTHPQRSMKIKSFNFSIVVFLHNKFNICEKLEDKCFFKFNKVLKSDNLFISATYCQTSNCPIKWLSRFFLKYQEQQIMHNSFDRSNWQSSIEVLNNFQRKKSRWKWNLIKRASNLTVNILYEIILYKKYEQ